MFKLFIMMNAYLQINFLFSFFVVLYIFCYQTQKLQF